MNRTRAWAGAIAGSIALADGVIYLMLIQRQGDSSPVPWVFPAIVLGALAAGAGWIVSPGRVASILLGSSAAVFLVLGVLGIFSIGLPLLLAAAFSAVGVQQAGRNATSTGTRGPLVLAGVGAAGVLLAAFLLFQIGKGGTTVSVECSASARGSGMPTVPGAVPRATTRSHGCRTITSP
jgi:hypothetical protein